AEAELDAGRDDRGRARLELEQRMGLRCAGGLRPRTHAYELRLRDGGGDERLEPLDPGRLLLRAREEGDARVAVPLHVLDEQLDAGDVLEGDGARAGAVDDAVEEDAGR